EAWQRLPASGEQLLHPGISDDECGRGCDSIPAPGVSRTATPTERTSPKCGGLGCPKSRQPPSRPLLCPPDRARCRVLRLTHSLSIAACAGRRRTNAVARSL